MKIPSATFCLVVNTDSCNRTQELLRFVWLQGASRINQEPTYCICSEPAQLLPIRHNHPSGYSLGKGVSNAYFRVTHKSLTFRSQNGAQWVLDQLSIGAATGRKQAAYQGEKAGDAVKEGATYATNRASEAAQKVSDKVKEEL